MQQNLTSQERVGQYIQSAEGKNKKNNTANQEYRSQQNYPSGIKVR